MRFTTTRKTDEERTSLRYTLGGMCSGHPEPFALLKNDKWTSLRYARDKLREGSLERGEMLRSA